MVIVVVVLVAVFVAAPVHDGAMHWAHHKMHRQQQVHPPLRSEEGIKNGVAYHPENAAGPAIAKAVEPVPGRVVAKELGRNLNGLVDQSVKDFFCMYHHAHHVFEEIGGVGVFFRVGKSMVHPVHDGVGARRQVGRALCQIGGQVEKPLPELVHGEHLMRSVAVMEEGLEEEADKPVCKKKNKDCH